MNRTKKILGIMLSIGVAAPASADTMKAMIRLREKVSMETLANDVRTPGSPRYGQPYTPEEIQNLAGPSDADYAATLNQLQNEGFTITSESKTHLWIGIEGDQENFAKVFQAQFNIQAQNNSQAQRQLLAPAVVPTHMYMIESVAGLDNRRHARPLYHLGKKSDSPVQAQDVPGITPTQIKTAYGLDSVYASGVSGQGQDIAIATYDDFDVSDVQAYYTQMNISPAPTVDKVSFNGTAQPNEGSAMETQLDVEFSGMIAPGVRIHVYTSAENSDAGELAMFTQILSDNKAKVVNYSWGSCETQLTKQHAQDMSKVFAQAIAQGVNITVATGDSGSDSCQNNTTVADWPAGHPDIVAVGGTTLRISGSTANETAWDQSGGGISSMFPAPAYQTGASLSYSGRAYPDVAFNADNLFSGQAIYAHQNGQPTWIVIGGTSMAAPQWAGFLALVGHARQAKNLPSLGFLNPLLYGAGSQVPQLLNDITSGSNGAYTAGVGYDLVTGYGTLKGQALLDYLTRQ